MKDLLAANRYARALFDICQVSHCDLEIAEELEAFAAALRSSPDAARFLASPYFDREAKINLIKKFYQERIHEIYETLFNFFAVLFQKNRFHLFYEIVENYRKIVDAERGMGTAEIRTARPLAPEKESAIVSRLEKLAGYRITVKKEVDPDLIGGLVVKIRNKILDGSIRHKIERMKKELTKVRSV
ncbi:MAG: ATP synthase F1 subunit delta [Candidatus Omnitrophica bacterium]|nr:ATP synthase F1 subunit delta [Candidatus Omnitrophota bacterium]